MSGDAKTVFACDGIAEGDEFFVLKLDQLLALGAVQMIMLRVAVVMFINRAACDFKFSKQPRVNEFAERPINGGAADVTGFPLAWQLVEQLICIEMLVLAKHMLQQKPALIRIPHALDLQILVKSLRRRGGDVDPS